MVPFDLRHLLLRVHTIFEFIAHFLNTMEQEVEGPFNNAWVPGFEGLAFTGPGDIPAPASGSATPPASECSATMQLDVVEAPGGSSDAGHFFEAPPTNAQVQDLMRQLRLAAGTASPPGARNPTGSPPSPPLSNFGPDHLPVELSDSHVDLNRDDDSDEEVEGLDFFEIGPGGV